MADVSETLDPIGAALAAATKGEFSILGTLGRGGMAAVYLARDKGLDRLVAIKVLLPELLAANPNAANRFVLEARTAAGLAHPHIVPIYTVRQTEGLHWFAMGFVDGWPLDALLKEKGPLPPAAVRTVLSQATAALAFAHRKSIVHRDLKPGNIMVDAEGRAVVLDFGIAKVAEAHGLTQTGLQIGTPTYMSPEQCRGLDATGASDQYALGAVAYELLAGAPMFQSENTFGLIYQHVHEVPRPIGDLVPACPPDLSAAIMRMVEKDPAQRWPSLAALGEALGPMRASDEAVLREVVSRETGPARVHPAVPVAPAPPPLVERALEPLTRDLPKVMADLQDQEMAFVVERGVPLRAATAVAVAEPESAVAARATVPMTKPSDTQTQELRPESVRLELAPRKSVLTLGQTFGLQALLAHPVPAGYPLVWASEDPSVVRVTPEGQATAEKIGVTTVLVRDGIGEARAKLEVTRVAVAQVRLKSPSPSLSVGDVVTLVATVHDRIGSVLEHRFVEWSTSDPRVATVSSTGVLTGRGPGVVTVLAVCGTTRAELDLRVGPERLTGVMVLPRTLSLVVGEEARVQAIPLTARGQARTARPISWGTTNPGVLQVFDDGTVRAIGRGLARVTAVVEGFRGHVPVEVRLPPGQH